MDNKASSQLKKAASKIRNKKLDDARIILISLLKKDPDLEYGWYMLSLCTSDKERQKYALSQVLRINPENLKARGKLEELEKEISVFSVSQEDIPPIDYGYIHDNASLPPHTKAFTDDDLLTQRLFGGSDIADLEIEVGDEIDADETSEIDSIESLFNKEHEIPINPTEEVKYYWDDEKIVGFSEQTWKLIGIAFGVILITIIVYLLLIF